MGALARPKRLSLYAKAVQVALLLLRSLPFSVSGAPPPPHRDSYMSMLIHGKE